MVEKGQVLEGRTQSLLGEGKTCVSRMQQRLIPSAILLRKLTMEKNDTENL